MEQDKKEFKMVVPEEKNRPLIFSNLRPDSKLYKFIEKYLQRQH